MERQITLFIQLLPFVIAKLGIDPDDFYNLEVTDTIKFQGYFKARIVKDLLKDVNTTSETDLKNGYIHFSFNVDVVLDLVEHSVPVKIVLT